jgi:hypothetical protein
MKRARFLKSLADLEREENAYRKRLNKWWNHVNACLADAPRELTKIYNSLVPKKHAIRTGKVEENVFCAKSESVLYIYEGHNNHLCYGPDEQEYPLFDDSLWPWSAVNAPLPSLPRDVWAFIANGFLHAGAMLNLAVTCKKLYELMHDESLWAKRREFLLDNLVYARPHLEDMPTWLFFSWIYTIYKKKKAAAALANHMDLALNLMLPIGGDVVSGFEVEELFPSPWHNGGKNWSVVLKSGPIPRWLTLMRQTRHRNFELMFNGYNVYDGSLSLDAILKNIFKRLLFGNVEELEYVSPVYRWL